MSIKTTNTRVRSVVATSAPSASAGGAAGAAIGGAILLGAVINGYARFLGKTARDAYKQSVTALPPAQSREIKSIAVLQTELKNWAQTSAVNENTKSLAPVDQAKVSVLASLTATPYFISNQANLEQSLKQLGQAATIEEVRETESVLLRQIKTEHQDTLLQSVTLACRNAALECGFATIQSDVSPDGMIRVIASDVATGRALITEINTDKNAELMLATEVVGISDGSCSEVLDVFEAGLDAQGVRRQPGKRAFTGGVCELAAAREFVRRKLKPRAKTVKSPAPKTTERNNTATKRTQKLNNAIKQQQR